MVREVKTGEGHSTNADHPGQKSTSRPRMRRKANCSPGTGEKGRRGTSTTTKVSREREGDGEGENRQKWSAQRGGSTEQREDLKQNRKWRNRK